MQPEKLTTPIGNVMPPWLSELSYPAMIWNAPSLAILWSTTTSATYREASETKSAAESGLAVVLSEFALVGLAAGEMSVV